MSTKTALIVDDSKTAQIRLKKLLGIYDTQVEIAYSAEEALTLLPSLSPDIIFMDHTMDGMDGLEALKLIKNNPSTAMIPVIMYTAQADEVYLSQARALGALDTLSKDVFKQSNLDNLMSMLYIQRKSEQEEIEKKQKDQIPVAEASASAFASASSAAGPNLVDTLTPIVNAYKRAEEVKLSATVEKPEESKEESKEKADQKQNQESLATTRPGHDKLADMLSAAEMPFVVDPNDEQALLDTYGQRYQLHKIQVLLGSQSKKLESLQDKFEHLQLDTLSLGDLPLSVIHDESLRERERVRFSVNSLIIIFIMFAAAAAFFLYQFSQQINELKGLVTDLGREQVEQYEIDALLENDSLVPLNVEPVTPSKLNEAELLETLDWAMSIDMRYKYEESPLNEAQMLNVQDLVYKLSQSGFSGVISLNIHIGNYCLESDTGSDTWKLAADLLPIQACTFYEEVYIEVPPENFLSIPFIQFEQSSVPIQSGEIEVKVTVSGFTAPIEDYPSLDSVTTVKEWNTIAAQNNRVTVDLELSN